MMDDLKVHILSNIWQVLDFTFTYELALLFVKEYEFDEFNLALHDRFAENENLVQTKFAVFSNFDINYYNPEESDSIYSLLRNFGVDQPSRIPGGYYLFRKGLLVTHTNGIGLMESSFWDYVKANISFSKQKRREMVFESISHPLVAFFNEKINAELVKDEEQDWRKAQESINPNKDFALVSAFKYFGLEPINNKDELKKARNKLLSQFHPDKSANDPKDFDRNTEITKKINETYNFILKKAKFTNKVN